MVPLFGPEKVNSAVPLLQMGEVELTLATNGGLTFTVELPVTGFEHDALLTEVRITDCAEVAFGIVKMNAPVPSRFATAGVPFNV